MTVFHRSKSLTDRAVLFLSRIPITIVRRSVTYIHDAVRIQIAGVTERQPIVGMGIVAERIVQDSPSAHSSHIAELALIGRTIEIGSQRMPFRFEYATARQIRKELTLHKVARSFLRYVGMRIPHLYIRIVPKILITLHRILQGIFCQSIRRFVGCTINNIFGMIRIRIVIDEEFRLTFPVTAKTVGVCGFALSSKILHQTRDEQFVITAPFEGFVILAIQFRRVMEIGQGCMISAIQIA